MGYRARLITNGPLNPPEWFISKYSDVYHVDNCGVSSKEEEKYYKNTYQDIEIFKDIKSTLDSIMTVEATLIYEDGKVVVVDINKYYITAYHVRYTEGESYEVEKTLGKMDSLRGINPPVSV